MMKFVSAQYFLMSLHTVVKFGNNFTYLPRLALCFIVCLIMREIVFLYFVMSMEIVCE